MSPLSPAGRRQEADAEEVVEILLEQHVVDGRADEPRAVQSLYRALALEDRDYLLAIHLDEAQLPVRPPLHEQRDKGRDRARRVLRRIVDELLHPLVVRE